MADKKIQVRILPLHNIGGVGKAGDVIWMVEAEAHYYAREGYVEILEKDTPTPPSPLMDLTPSPSPKGEGGEEEEDHKIMKPARKRKA